MTDAEKALLKSFQTFIKNKKELCKGRSCSECIFDRSVDDLYDDDGDCMTMCNSIDYVSVEINNILD